MAKWRSVGVWCLMLYLVGLSAVSLFHNPSHDAAPKRDHCVPQTHWCNSVASPENNSCVLCEQLAHRSEIVAVENGVTCFSLPLFVSPTPEKIASALSPLRLAEARAPPSLAVGC